MGILGSSVQKQEKLRASLGSDYENYLVERRLVAQSRNVCIGSAAVTGVVAFSEVLVAKTLLGVGQALYAATGGIAQLEGMKQTTFAQVEPFLRNLNDAAFDNTIPSVVAGLAAVTVPAVFTGIHWRSWQTHKGAANEMLAAGQQLPPEAVSPAGAVFPNHTAAPTMPTSQQSPDMGPL